MEGIYTSGETKKRIGRRVKRESKVLEDTTKACIREGGYFAAREKVIVTIDDHTNVLQTFVY